MNKDVIRNLIGSRMDKIVKVNLVLKMLDMTANREHKGSGGGRSLLETRVVFSTWTTISVSGGAPRDLIKF